jgi:hypothetical protein
MAQIDKRKIDGEWHLMPDTEYSLCGLAFDGGIAHINEDTLQSTLENMEAEDLPCKSAREINCDGCKHRINVIRQLLKIAPPAKELTALQSRIAELERERDELKIALADAIRSPMGVMPDSARGWLTDAELDAAESRRPRV